ncbi:MAG TPA: prenyltransferase/squalene oxidase repeat-containing protein [Tepidiformaceae bacterium]|nr:prenyltransferase/squalene oxidase repeat-containing protein [Tepidiformaceae bacterium]
MRLLLGALAAAILAIPLAGIAGALPEPAATYAGARYIQATQQSDGGFGGFGPGQTMDAIYALRAAGVDPNTIEKDGNSPADYLLAHAPDVATAAEAGKAALAAVALGLNPTNVNGVNLLAIITGKYDSATGKYAADDFSQSIAMIGLAGSGGTIPGGAIEALRATQLEDGGWGFGGFSDPDTTGIAIQALIAAGLTAADPDVAAALAYFQATQNADGGWGFGGESNASSTAFAVQAIIAAGQDPEAAPYIKDGANPVSYLLGLQQADGSFPGFDPAYATNQVVPALAGRPFKSAPTTNVTTTLPPLAAPATATPTTTVTAPKPPNTGTGTIPGTGSGLPLELVAAIGIALAGTGLVLGARRK